MFPAAKEETFAPLSNGEEIFFLAAGVVAALETHQRANAAQGKKPHQGIFSKNRRLRVGATWAKWSGTHQDSGRSWWKIVSGSALDANGNTLSDPQGRSYTWDFENRLTQVVTVGSNAGTTTFKYDPFGKRIYKQSPNFTSILLFDADNLIETLNAAGVEVTSYTETRKIDEALAETRGGTTDYYLADGLGSITSLSGSSGILANTYTYDSFGNLTNFTGTLRNPFQYAGREWDTETSLYFNRARYYDPTVGRFVSEDPIKFKGGIDFYAYVKNRPTKLVDPTGTDGWDWISNAFKSLWGCFKGKCDPPPAFDSASAYLVTCPCRNQGDTEKTCSCIGWPLGADTTPGSEFMNQCQGCYGGQKSPRAACKCACTTIGKSDAQCNLICDTLPDK